MSNIVDRGEQSPMNAKLTLGQLKQLLAAINNQVNNEVFGRGLKTQKIYINDNVILILAVNQRVPALATLDKQGLPTREIDLVLLDAYKTRLRELIQERLELSIITVLKDYDPKKEISGNIIMLEEDLVYHN